MGQHLLAFPLHYLVFDAVKVGLLVFFVACCVNVGFGCLLLLFLGLLCWFDCRIT